MIHLVLSLDYEIFGNGAGDVMRDIVHPTDRLLDLCDKYGAKLTIMFEVGEYWAFERYDDQLRRELGYSPCEAMKTQAVNAIERGHDLQLHLHPQWIGASFENGQWRLHPEYRRITDLPNGIGAEGDLFSALGVLREGRRTLEDMICPVHPEYECSVYRAAMFWGQPSGDLIASMKEAGLIADSSVIPGLYETTPVPTDYREAPSNAGYWWTNDQDISLAGPTYKNIIEFPVCSRVAPYLSNFKWTKLRATLLRRRRERTNIHGHGMMHARKSTDSLFKVFEKIWTRQPLKLDFCKLGSRDMIYWLRQRMRNCPARLDNTATPIVMLGHSKDFWNDHHLAAFLRFVTNECQDRVCCRTFADVTKMITEREVEVPWSN